MRDSISKYRFPEYWEAALAQKDVWNGVFDTGESLHAPIFVNTCVIDQGGGLFDNNWACYPNIQALLGFVQYVFLPTVFYYQTEQENGPLTTPIYTKSEFLSETLSSASPHKLAMASQIKQVETIWTLAEQSQQTAMRQFSLRFNHYWAQQSCKIVLELSFGVQDIADKLKEIIWCEELFAEETGYTTQEFDRLCARFQKEDLARHILMRVLNERVGCIV